VSARRFCACFLKGGDEGVRHNRKIPGESFVATTGQSGNRARCHPQPACQNPAQQRVCRFLAEETLKGNASRLKEIVNGTEVFDRAASYAQTQINGSGIFDERRSCHSYIAVIYIDAGRVGLHAR
jgi:hypothetical protein